MHKAVSDTLYVYRRYCAVSANPGQLILPEALKLLPLYALALTKMAAFRCASLPATPPPLLQTSRVKDGEASLHARPGL